MKKIGIICMMAAISAIGLSSCQESAEKQENTIAIKIENKEALTPEEYSTMIDYVGEYAEKAQKYVDMQINGVDLSEAAAGMTKLKAEFPYLDTYRDCIRFTPASSLSPENLEKVGKYAGYIEFSAPSGYTLQTNPEAAGLEEQSPAEPNGVVAGAVDDVKVEDRGW